MNEPLKAALADIGFYDPGDVHAATVSAIRKILDVLPAHDKWCVEFGAWDGIVGSNTRDLISTHDYSAILIEGDAEKFRDLQKNYLGKSNVTTLNQFVGFGKTDGLDAIFAATSIPREFDFLSVDIDGNDYHVWKALENYHPKLVSIEFNPTIPPEVCFVQPADPSVSQGGSLAAMIALGKEKGYELISVMGVNAFFVAAKYYPLLQLDDNGIDALWTKRDCVTYIFSGYDGRIFLSGCKKLPWHEGVALSESKMQVLPPFLQGTFTRRKRLLHTCLTDPPSFARKIVNRLGNLNPFKRPG